MPKVLPCNAFEIGHTKETFTLILRYESPDGHKETVYVVISPAGATILNEHLGKELQEYEKENGKIELGEWKPQKQNLGGSTAEPTYLS